MNARTAYAEASEGPAKEFAPQYLLAAKQAVRAAEKELGESRQEERALAYIAQRKVRLAISQALIVVAKKQLEQLAREYQSELESNRRRTKKRLGQTNEELQRKAAELRRRQEELAKSEAELRKRGAELSKKNQELSKKDAELSKKNRQLEAERKARAAAEARAAAALKKVEEFAKVAADKRGMVITLSGSVIFKSGRSSVLPLARERLAKVATALKEVEKGKRIIVAGHTDSRGSSGRNQRLSLSRARAVRSVLVAEGVLPEKISAVGRGEDEPIASNRTAEGRANNRRVEIIVR